MNDKILKQNGKCVALFLFQYSLMIPLMSFVSSSIIIAITTICIVLFMIYSNIDKGIITKVVFFMFMVFLFFIIKAVLDPKAALSLVEHFFGFILPPGVVMLYNFNRDSFLGTCEKLSIINFFVLFLNPFMPNYNYMRFGYGMVLTVIFVIISIRNGTSKRSMIFKYLMLIISLLELFIYGARGCMISVGLFYILYRFLVYKDRVCENILIACLVSFLYSKLISIIDIAYAISLRVGIASYAIAKYKMQLRSGWKVASSTRDILYQDSLKLIKAHPYIGNPMELSLKDGEYVHNLFLQVAQDMGIMALFILVIILTLVLIKVFSSKTIIQDRIILCALFAIAIGRLMFSSTLWKRPEFWLMLSFYCAISGRFMVYKIRIKVDV